MDKSNDQKTVNASARTDSNKPPISTPAPARKPVPNTHAFRKNGF